MNQSAAILTNEELSQIRNVDRLLPSQKVMSKKFNGNESEFYNNLERLLLSVLPAKSLEEKWDIKLKPGVTYASLGSDLG
ncbi:MAG: hypothetical protein WCJ33_07395, partial [Pseudomonadota bacterium]